MNTKQSAANPRTSTSLPAAPACLRPVPVPPEVTTAPNFPSDILGGILANVFTLFHFSYF